VAQIDPTLLERAAAMYAEASPAAIRCGWGPERNRNGGSAIAAVLALPAVAGKFGVRGGGYTMSNGRALALGDAAAIAQPEVATREINMNQVGRVLTAGRSGGVFALFVYNCNPLATLPDQNAVRRGLLRPDLFTIVFDQVMTDTARYADVVLPATTFLEHDELRSGYGAMAVQRSRPVVPPWGEARPNYAVFAELCERLGLARPGDPIGADALAHAVLADSALPEAVLGALAEGDVAAIPGPIQFVDELPRTDDRRIHLVPPSLDAEAGGLYRYREDPETAAHPLALISPAVARQVSSTFGQLDRRPAALHMHPDDAAARGLADGDRIRVFNDLGDVVCRMAIDHDMRPGVVGLAKGLWSHHTENGATANALCPDALADLGGGATFNDARVQVEAAP
jgi:anaerobic selenocysteine-containing dehydrogenase